MLFAASFILLLGAAGQVADTRLARPVCDDRTQKIQAPRKAGPHTLNRESNADRVLTVLRRDENGCSRPVRVSRDIGAQPKR